MIRSIASDDFPPFGKLELELPEVPDRPNTLGEAHIFTGVNGTGKTRLLALVAAMLGGGETLQKRLLPRQVVHFRTSVASGRRGGSGRCDASDVFWESTSVPNPFDHDHAAFAYGGAAYVADTGIGVLVGQPRPDRQACLSFGRPPHESKILLQAVANLKLQAAMDSLHEQPAEAKSERAVNLLRSVEDALTGITGRPFSFQLTTYPEVALRARWGDTTLPFLALPDGLRSLLGWLVHAVVMTDVYLQGKVNPKDAEAIFLIDEIECHLHPAWQGKVLPAFQRLFPRSQILVATHSPFVITSLNFGWIHPITLAEDGRAILKKPEPASQGDSYVSVVEQIMGIPERFDTETEGLLTDFRKHREAAYRGQPGAQGQAIELANKIAARSLELQFIMGRELAQLDRQLKRTPTPA